MSEIGRMARGAGEPVPGGPAGAARWADYLDWMRSALIDGVLALPPDEQRTARVPSGWSPIELLSHCLHMEQRWFVWGFRGEPVAEPWGDWDVPDPTVANEKRWQVPVDLPAERLAERLAEIGAGTRALLEETPLEQVAATGGRFSSDPPTLEWICFHVLAEYARHLGHLDIVVELAQPA